MCSLPSEPEHHEADVNIQAVTYDTYHSAVTIWGSYRQQLWSVVFMDTCAILQAYPTYIQVPNKLSLQIVHYYELWEADFQYWKGNIQAFVSQKWVRENNSLNYLAAKLLSALLCVTCYNFKLWRYLSRLNRFYSGTMFSSCIHVFMFTMYSVHYMNFAGIAELGPEWFYSGICKRLFA